MNCISTRDEYQSEKCRGMSVSYNIIYIVLYKYVTVVRIFLNII